MPIDEDARAHHHVPQLLLRGFASRVTGKGKRKQWYCWRYAQGAEPHQPNIKNIGQQRDFHGRGQLEASIGRLEGGPCGDLVRRLRLGDTMRDGDDQLARDLVNHLTIRTRNLRDSLAATVPQLLDALATVYSADSSGSRIKLKLRDALEKELDNHPIFQMFIAAGVPREVLLSVADTELAQRGGAQHLFVQAVRWVKQNVDYQKLAAKSHVDVLSKPETLPLRSRLLENLHWRVERYDPHSFILGDIAVLAKGSAGEFTHTLLVQPDVTAVSLPLSHSLLLIGEQVVGPRPAPDAVNLGSCTLSRYCFFASQRTHRESGYHSRLAERAELMNVKQVTALIESDEQSSP